MISPESLQFEHGLAQVRDDRTRGAAELARVCLRLLINKAGAYLLALAARDQGVPFYVCSERFKQRQPG